MGLHEGSLLVCPRNQHCSKWAQIYMKYCLCSVKDGISLTLGLVSVISWGVAEVPQIITNYKTKSAEGLSIAFLMTWIVGDIFNLFGCMLEPATLYTATTVILASQTIYYGHIYHRLKANKKCQLHKGPELHQADTVIKSKQTGYVPDDKEQKFTAKFSQIHGSSVEEGIYCSTSPIPVSSTILLPRYGSFGKESYYTSARSLSRSHTPTMGSYFTHKLGSPRTPPHPIPIHVHNSVEEPLLGQLSSVQSAPPLNTKSMLCVVSVVTFLLSSFNLHRSANSRFYSVLIKEPQGIVIRVGRKLLQRNDRSSLTEEYTSSGIGTFLGWAMAAIYMGGRLPQIFLNIRRGNVEGLNPLMFIFALIGNSTYLASILVSSLEWSRIRPNLPWLADAGGCIILDSFIVLQFIYFHYRKLKVTESNHDHFVAVEKIANKF
ncbi:PQ-loop repeat family protein / transmembrane family protein isoform X2 [Tasmannia lanceolata]|uniref:PQ-loop repeat family protein / transmembrane family protein isoform X2 n=1 Tax=Tasmannia lanceolata TaxID=3420 RepID=UPI00406316EA